MPKIEIAKSSETRVSRPRNVFAAMRDDMDRAFENFEREYRPRLYEWPRWPSILMRTTTAELLPTLSGERNGDIVLVDAGAARP